MFGEPLNPISWWWYALAVSGLWAIGLLWVPNQQGRRRALRWGVQLWVAGWPLPWGNAITLASMGLAVPESLAFNEGGEVDAMEYWSGGPLMYQQVEPTPPPQPSQNRQEAVMRRIQRRAQSV